MAFKLGTNGNDSLQGAALADQIFRSFSNDTLLRLGRDDLLQRDQGNDLLNDGDSSDRLFRGDDTVKNMFLAIFKKVKQFFIRRVKDKNFHSELLSKKIEGVKKAVENGSMQIADLPYLQNVSKDELILGSAGMSVISRAFAFGSNSYPFASTNINSQAWSIDNSTANGIGFAESFGDNSTVAVVTAGDGDVGIGINQFKSSKNNTVANGFAISIDLPSTPSISDLLESLF